MRCWRFGASEDYLPQYRSLGVVALCIMLVSLPLFAFKDGTGAYIREYWGIFWHLSMFLFISKLPTPQWGRAAGYSWVTLDVLTGMLYISGVPGDETNHFRMAAHLFLGMWLMSSVFTSTSRWVKITGFVAGAWLFGYSWVSPFVSEVFLLPNSPFFIAFMILIALGKYAPKENEMYSECAGSAT